MLLIDTPGFNDTLRSDGDITVEISKCLLAQKRLGVRLMGVLYLHDITQARMTGSFNKELEILKRMVGIQNYKHIILVTTKWALNTGQSNFEKRHAELQDKYWKDLINEGAGVCKFDGSPESAIGIVSQLNTVAEVTLALQDQMTARKHTPLEDTDVGKYVLEKRRKNESEYKLLSKKKSSKKLPDEMKPKETPLEELKASLRLGQNDPAKLKRELDDEIEQKIREIVQDEMKNSPKKPVSAIDIISKILSLTVTILTAVASFAPS